MQLTNFFVSLLLSTAVMAKGNSTKTAKTKAVTDKSLCAEMNGLEAIVKLASNTTKLDAKLKGNETKVAEFQSKASAAASQLSTMQSNTTLMSTCSAIDEAEKTKATCHEMDALQQVVALAANTTKLESKLKGNTTKIAKFQEEASKAQTKLDSMTSNTTLTDACASVTSDKESKKAAASATSTSSSSKSTSSTSGAVLNAQVGGIFSAAVVVAFGTLFL